MHLFCVCLANAFLIVVSPNIASVTSRSIVLRNSVVLIGDRVEMNCSVTGSGLTTWIFTPWNTLKEINIYLGVAIFHSVKSRYKINKRINGQHNLIIDSVDLNHAGRYKCTSDIHEKTLITDTQLIVLGCEPKCDTNSSLANGSVIEHSYLWMWCRVNYTGNVIPIFNMTKENSQGVIIDYESTAEYYTTPVTRNAEVTCITQLNSDDNGAQIKLRITFQLSNSFVETLPAFTWNYTANVLYGPKNLTIIRLEDRLLCAANGNPNPIYKWINFEANRSTAGPVHLLNYAMESDKNYTIQCEATNALASERQKLSHFQASMSGDTDSSGKKDAPDFLLIALGVGGSLIFLLMMAIVVSCIVHTKRLKDNTSHRPDVALHTDVPSYESGAGTIADNAVYAQVMKPKGPSKGNKGGNIGESSRPHYAPKDITGADGTVYAELSGVKPPDRKGKAQVPKTPAFNKVEIYASIDHCGNAPAPPLPPK